jgi:hypothetical protein
MPAYVIKVIDEDGWLRPPVVANCADEGAALKLVRSLVPDGASIVIKGIRPDVMAGQSTTCRKARPHSETIGPGRKRATNRRHSNQR